jgi:hypothetical protein
MAWTWTRLALEAEQFNPRTERILKPLGQPSSPSEPRLIPPKG